MGYAVLTALLLIIAVGLLCCAARLLFQPGVLLPWLKGTLGWIMALVALFVALLAYDVYGYRQVESGQNIATMSFRQRAPQQYLATFVTAKGDTRYFELYGDQWQLDSRILRWHPFLLRFGMHASYRLDKISGRYLLLGEGAVDRPNSYGLFRSIAHADLWYWLNRWSSLTLVKALHGNSTYLPMVDTGQYQISISPSGLLVTPLNKPAKDAVAQWR